MKFVILGIFLVLSVQAAAFGVGADFLPDNTILLPEGTTRQFNIYLQNTDDTAMQARVRVSGDGGVAVITPEYNEVVVAAGDTNFKIPINVSQPPDSEIGDIFIFEYAVQPQSTSGPGLEFSPGISRRVTVQIVESPDKFYWSKFLLNTGPLWVLLIVVMGGYVWLSRHERKK